MDDDILTLYPGHWRTWGLLLLSMLGAGVGIGMAWQGSWVGYVVLVPSSLGVLLGGFWLLPSRAFLHITPEALIYCKGFRAQRLAWRDVERFGVARIGEFDRVAWDYAPHYPAEATRRETLKARIGFEAVLPTDCCRLSSDQLADLLNDRKRRSANGRA
ncbi:hypothetical protein BH23PLA1_BH23PLA1_12820 [soil metagenome]